MAYYDIRINGDSEVFKVEIIDPAGIVLDTIVLNTNTNIGDYLPTNPWTDPNQIVITTFGATIDLITTNDPDLKFVYVEDTRYEATTGSLKDHGSSNPWHTNVVNVEYSEHDTPDVINPYNKTYLVNSEVMADFGNIKPVIIGSGEGVTTLNDNLTSYVINLVSVPFKLPDDVVGSDTNIVLGDFDTEIIAPSVLGDLLPIDWGSIEVDGFFNNSLDYEVVEYTLHLPYSDYKLVLKPNDVFNKTIQIEYLLDVYNGDCSVNIYNGGDVPIESVSINIGRKIPFKLSEEIDLSVGSLSGDGGSISRAYITKRVRVVDETIGNSTVSVEGVLGGYTGYLEVDNIELDCNASGDEKNQLVSILKQGVYINE